MPKGIKACLHYLERALNGLIVSSIKTLLMSVKIRNLQTKVIKEKDGTYAIACSALGVYSVGKTLKEAKKSFEQALDLHLSVLRERAVKEIEAVAV